MKKFIFSTVVLFSLFIAGKAQNASPYWSLAGNSNATGSSKLGTSNSMPLRLLTNNSERVRIDASGKVGIGTTSPTSKLHVIGTGLFTANLDVSNGGITGYNSSGTGVSGNSSSSGGYGVYGKARMEFSEMVSITEFMAAPPRIMVYLESQVLQVYMVPAPLMV